MTIQELYDFLGDFIEKHPECKNQRVMVKNMCDDSTWEDVTFISDTVVEHCSQYGSPLYLHSKSQEEVTKDYEKKMRELNEEASLDDFSL